MFSYDSGSGVDFHTGSVQGTRMISIIVLFRSLNESLLRRSTFKVEKRMNILFFLELRHSDDH